MYKLNVYSPKRRNIYNDKSIYKYDPNIPGSREDQLAARVSTLIARDMLDSFRDFAKNMVSDMSAILDEAGETRE
jgi:hypothetical protein